MKISSDLAINMFAYRIELRIELKTKTFNVTVKLRNVMIIYVGTVFDWWLSYASCTTFMPWLSGMVVWSDITSKVTSNDTSSGNDSIVLSLFMKILFYYQLIIISNNSKTLDELQLSKASVGRLDYVLYIGFK